MAWALVGSVALRGVKLVFKNLQTSILVAAIAAAGAFSYLYNMEKATREQNELASHGLPPGILAKYIQQNRELLKLVKDAEGKTRVERIYIPDEGKVTIVTKERDEAIKKYNEILDKIKHAKDSKEIEKLKEILAELLDEVYKPPKVIVKTKGFTSRFGYGLVINPDFTTTITGRRQIDLPLTVELDWKFAYCGKWSALVQVNPYFFGPAITYHIVDIVPKRLHFNNLEVGLTGGYRWSGGTQVGVILRSNF